jgi:signal transduction histidine kinase
MRLCGSPRGRLATASRMTDRAPHHDVEPALGEGGARRALMADFVAAGELERRRVAEAIHDDSIQVLAAMGMRLQMLRRSLDDTAQLTMLGEAEATVQLSIRRLRALVFELQPPGLDGEGVSVALGIALEAANRDGGTVYRLDDRFVSPPGAEEGAILFRVAQEALANVRVHAQATNATVTLLERDGGHAVVIADDGCGCDPDPIASGRAGYGFRSMRTRAALAGGNLRIDSRPGGGTTVEVWLPGGHGAPSDGARP